MLERHYEGNIKKKIRSKKIKFPIVAKPVNEGSSIDVYICKNFNEFHKAYNRLSDYKRIIIEEYIPGREIQVAVMGRKALGAIELVPKRKFYDYKAKYTSKAKTIHLMPAPIQKKKYLVCQLTLVFQRNHSTMFSYYESPVVEISNLT